MTHSDRRFPESELSYDRDKDEYPSPDSLFLIYDSFHSLGDVVACQKGLLPSLGNIVACLASLPVNVKVRSIIQISISGQGQGFM